MAVDHGYRLPDSLLSFVPVRGIHNRMVQVACGRTLVADVAR